MFPSRSRTRLRLWQGVPCQSYHSQRAINQVRPIPFHFLLIMIMTFLSLEVTRNKIWNGEYVELALLLKQNFSSTQSVSGTLAIIDNQLSIKPATSKIKQPINSIEMWSDAFINFILVYIQKHIAKASDLLRYMAVIRGAAVNNPISKWLVYDMQFRLRTSKDPNRSWS